MERWCDGQGIGSIHGRCRVHRAEILRLRGESAAAERVVLEACAELRPYLRREFGWPLTELGRVRFQMGDLPVRRRRFSKLASRGGIRSRDSALVRLAQGDVGFGGSIHPRRARASLTVPSKELPPNTRPA